MCLTFSTPLQINLGLCDALQEEEGRLLHQQQTRARHQVRQVQPRIQVANSHTLSGEHFFAFEC